MDAYIIAGGIHDLIIQKFKDQQDFRSRHQIEEILNSKTAENLFDADRLLSEYQPTDNETGCLYASSIAQEHLIHSAGKIGKQFSADKSVNRSPSVPTIINTLSQDIHLSPTEHWH